MPSIDRAAARRGDRGAGEPARVSSPGAFGRGRLAGAVLTGLALGWAAAPAAAAHLKEGAWEEQARLPHPVTQHRVLAARKGLVVLGGRDRFGKAVAGVWQGTLSRGGDLGRWRAREPLPAPLADHGAGTADGSVVITGGVRGTAKGEEPTDRVLVGTLGENGSVGTWSAGARLPAPVYAHGQATVGSRVYVAGGMRGGEYLREVLVGEMAQGRIASWRPTLPLPVALGQVELVSVGRYLVVIGGRGAGQGKSLVMPTTYVGPVWEDGEVRTWYLASSKLPGAYLGYGRCQTSAAVYGNAIFAFGGQDALWFMVDSVAVTAFDPERGTLTPWGVVDGRGFQTTATAVWEDHVYLVGGTVEGAATARVLRGTFAGSKK